MQLNPSLIAAQPHLKEIPLKQIENLSEDALPVEFKPGERIYLYQGHSARFYLILNGLVELELPGPPGEVDHVKTLGAGDVLGWSWLFPQHRLRLDARAIAPTKAIFFYGTQLRELCAKRRDCFCELMQVFLKTSWGASVTPAPDWRGKVGTCWRHLKCRCAFHPARFGQQTPIKVEPA